MATHTLAILVEAVGAAKASKELKGVDATISKMGATAGRGLRTAGKAIAVGIGAAAVGIGAAVNAGVDSLVQLESATTTVDGAIKQMGLTGKVTGAQVAGWSNEIEAATQAAFDDKDITAAAGSLIRYGKVTETNLRPAMVVMTDLAARTGDVGSAGKLLGKALADPAKATGALRKAGIVLTATQEKQIKALAKVNDKTKAQAMLLEIMSGTTTGAAAAMNGPMKDAQETLKDVVEDSQRALAEGFLPVLERVSKKLSEALGNPSTLAAIRSFGKGLAGAFDSVVTFAEKIDWGKIGSGLKIAADWGGKLVGAISKMPPEALAAIVALGGLNKLSGGAVSGIVGELGKGLIKGVLGMTAGVVNINAGVVNGGGGLPGKGGGVPGVPPVAAGGLGATLSAVLAPASVALIGAAVANAVLWGVPAVVAEIWGKPKPEKGVNPTSARDPGFQATRQVNALLANVPRMAADTTQVLATLRTTQQADRGQASQQLAAMNGVKQTQAQSLVAFRAAERTFANQPRPVVNVSTNVKVNVTAANVTRSVAVRERYGTTGGSRALNGNRNQNVPQ